MFCLVFVARCFLSPPLGLAINFSLTLSTCQSLFIFLVPGVFFFYDFLGPLLRLNCDWERIISFFFSNPLLQKIYRQAHWHSASESVSQSLKSVTQFSRETSVDLSLATGLSVSYPANRFFFLISNDGAVSLGANVHTNVGCFEGLWQTKWELTSKLFANVLGLNVVAEQQVLDIKVDLLEFIKLFRR